MIEGAQIDGGGHDNNLKYVTSEFKDFNAAIQEALNFAKYYGNTLVVVTADHETGGLALLGGKKNRVFGKFNTEGHSATMVPVFSFGPNAESFKGIYENTEIFFNPFGFNEFRNINSKINSDARNRSENE